MNNSEKEAEKEQQEQEQQEQQEKPNEHDKKYFVVHGALCACDKAVNPKQTAKLLVTSQCKVIFNAREGKLAATDADKTFDPAVATFGKCKLQPTTFDYKPCSLTPAPKWTKPYDKMTVYGNKALTEISTLECTIGGKIEVVAHGQTVLTDYSENTNPAIQALLNPGIKMPDLKPSYPSVSNITLKSVKSNPAFKAVSSATEEKVEQVVVRIHDECVFDARVEKGNVDLTSWIIYEGFTGSEDKIIFSSEQIGTTFENSFPTLGKYRVEGYGKPKKEAFEQGKYRKNYPDCSIDIEVVENKLEGDTLETIDADDFTRNISGHIRLRQNFPASFKPKFLMPPTDNELERLKMYVTDASGNHVKCIQIGNTVSFKPLNSKAIYIVTAVYKTESGQEYTQSFTGETICNTVSAISHSAEVVRPGTLLHFLSGKECLIL